MRNIVLQLLQSRYRCKWQVSIHGQLVDKISENLHISGCVATQYDEIQQRTTKEHYTGPQRIGNTAKDPQRTAKEHNGLSCRKLAPTELNGALYSSARQDFSNAAGLSWEPALSDSQSVRRGRPCYLWTWKFHSLCSHQKHRLSIADWKALSEPQRQCVRHAVFSLACEGIAGTQQSTSTDGNFTVLHRIDAGKKLGSRRRPRTDRTTTQNKKQKLWLICHLVICSLCTVVCRA